MFVTHNVREAVRLGDRVVVLTSRPGRVVDEFAVADRRGPGGSTRRRSRNSPAQITDRLREEIAAMATRDDRHRVPDPPNELAWLDVARSREPRPSSAGTACSLVAGRAVA